MHFFKNVHVQKIQKYEFPVEEKQTPEEQRRTQPVAFKKQQHLSPMNLPFLQKSQKSIFPQIRFFGNVFPYPGDFLLKTKMVRTVHRNILYSVDLKICDSKRRFGTKSQNRHFQKWGLKFQKIEFDVRYTKKV